jgi:hypothetical protein
MSWKQSTFVFISTNAEHDSGGVEDRWLPLMRELVARGATVQFLCMAEGPLAQAARDLGVGVAPYILDRWNVVRSRSRLRKYLKRYEPVCAHSTGVEADLLLRWAARKVPGVRIATTLTLADSQRTRRRGPINALMLRFDDAGLKSEDAVFLESEDLLDEVRASGVHADKIVLDPPAHDPDDLSRSVARHLEVYRGFIVSGRMKG